MISIKDKLPIPNTMCIVQTVPYLREYTEPFRYITYSDSTGYFWDNLVNEILQDNEVTHWKEYEKNKQTRSY